MTLKCIRTCCQATGTGDGTRNGNENGDGDGDEWEMGNGKLEWKGMDSIILFILKDFNASGDFDFPFAIILVFLYTKKSEKL